MARVASLRVLWPRKDSRKSDGHQAGPGEWERPNASRSNVIPSDLLWMRTLSGGHSALSHGSLFGKQGMCSTSGTPNLGIDRPRDTRASG